VTSSLYRLEIEAVLAEWAFCLDHAQYQRIAELFTPDGELHSGGTIAIGRDAIRARYAERIGERTTRHMYSGVRVSSLNEGQINASSVWVCWAANEAAPVDAARPYLVADFDDTFVRGVDDTWSIRRRRIVPVFRDATLAPVTA
jgi:hypothetical protein